MMLNEEDPVHAAAAGRCGPSRSSGSRPWAIRASRCLFRRPGSCSPGAVTRLLSRGRARRRRARHSAAAARGL